MILVIVLDLFQLISILLVLVFLFLGFKVLELKWSYKISKPHKWVEAIDHGEISNNIKKLERTYRDKVRFYTFWLQIERIKNEKIPELLPKWVCTKEKRPILFTRTY